MTVARPPLHPAIAGRPAQYHPDLVLEVAAAVAANDVVVVGVLGLQPDRRARKLLDAAGIPYRYLQYGSYLSGYRRRLALKLWVGWPTFPLIFVRGTFIGGGSDLKKLHASGELQTMLGRGTLSAGAPSLATSP